MEQRYLAVSAVIHVGLTVVEVASRFGVSRQTIHFWLLKFEKTGLPGLTNHSHKPRSCSYQIGADIDVLICEMRRRNPVWGPKRIEYELAKADIGVMPSQSAIYRALKRADLINPPARKRRDEKFKRWERGSPMELWQFEVVGGIYLADGSELKYLTDNGKVFTGRFAYKGTEVLFDDICRDKGIEHLLTALRSPTTTGKVERFHRTLRTKFLMEQRI